MAIFRSGPMPPGEALPGRTEPVLAAAARHHVFGRPLDMELPGGLEEAIFAMGCFWGVERLFWRLPGVWLTVAGYAGGHTPNPTYEEVCSGRTGHAEAVRVIHDPAAVSHGALLATFWEGHDPTQGMRQGNDRGTQYRSAIYTSDAARLEQALASRDAYQARLTAKGYGPITTEIAPAGDFWPAEEYHQQYLSKNPGGYCGIGGTGVSCPAEIA